MRLNPKEKEFASRLRNFIVEFFSVFFIVALNGTFLVLILVDVINKSFDKSTIALLGVLYLLFSCTISACLIYFVKGRVYHNKIKVFCDVANAVSKGDFSVRVPIYFTKPKSEMDFLAVNFNKMLVEISSLENMRNDFVADVSHEIKTPLSTIQGYADLLKLQNISDEKRQEYIELISDSIHKLSKLVSNILKLNKIENQEILQKEKFFLDEQIRCAVLGFEEELERKNISIDVALDEVVVKSDRAMLELVWNNLLSNAVKFTEPGGEISVSLKQEDDSVVFAVSDTGCGMDEETRKHIFEKFYQGDSSRSAEGNGLGLALVKKIVDILDGTISVNSELHKGTEMKVTLHI